MMMLSTSTIGFTAPSMVAAPMMHSRKNACVMQAEAEVDPDAGKFCYGLPGSIAPFENFDPAGLLKDKTKAEVYTWREAELTHGRVGMLAALGFLVQEWWHPLFGADGGPAISQMPALPAGIWIAMMFGVGISEGIRVARGWNDPSLDGHFFQKLKPSYYPGDLAFDPLGLKPTNEAELREMQTKELQNGRLAMLAAAGFMAQEAATGTTWGAAFGLPTNPFQ